MRCSHFQSSDGKDGWTCSYICNNISPTQMSFKQGKNYLCALMIACSESTTWINIQGNSASGFFSLMPWSHHDESFSHLKRGKSLFPFSMPFLIFYFARINNWYFRPGIKGLFDPLHPEAKVLGTPVVCSDSYLLSLIMLFSADAPRQLSKGRHHFFGHFLPFHSYIPPETIQYRHTVPSLFNFTDSS